MTAPFLTPEQRAAYGRRLRALYRRLHPATPPPPHPDEKTYAALLREQGGTR